MNDTSEYHGRWANNDLTKRIVQLAKDVSLYHRDPEKSDYINLCVGCKSGKVAAQIHKHRTRERGRMLVLRVIPQGFKLPEPLHIVENFEEISGDVSFNKQWLRATGKNFGHFSRATAVFVPNSILPESNDSEVWSALRKLLEYAFGNM